MSDRAKFLAAVFVVALMIRLITLAVLLPQLKPDVDLDSYRSLARNLAARKGFVAISEAGQELPNVARTPVYPLFLAGMIRLGGDRLGLFLAAQCLLGAATCGLTVLLAARWLPPRLAAMAGLLVAIDPNSVMRCSDLRTETLFTFLLAAGTCLLAWRVEKAWAWLVCGLLWSVAALCRPIAVYLPVVVLGVLAVSRLAWRTRFVYLAVFLAGFLPLLGLWAARNAVLTDQWFVSTIATHNLLMYRAAGVEAEKSSTNLEEMQRRFAAECGDVQFVSDRASFARSLECYRQTAMSVLRTARRRMIEQTTIGWGRVLFGPGTRSIDAMLREPRAAIYWWPPLHVVGLALVSGLSFLGAMKLRSGGILLTVLVFYFVILTGGPESNSRFRVPITPMLAVLAMAGLPSLRKTE